jgi:STAS-like domain of unknown function (DUF4325)
LPICLSDEIIELVDAPIANPAGATGLDMTATIDNLDPILNSPDLGIALAYRVRDRVNAGKNVVIDFSNAERMTPSFANAFAMTLLEFFPNGDWANYVTFIKTNDFVENAIRRSIDRHRRGIRLSTNTQPKISLG